MVGRRFWLHRQGVGSYKVLGVDCVGQDSVRVLLHGCVRIAIEVYENERKTSVRASKSGASC